MADEHTGAMIALIPAEEDAQRLAVPGGEPAEQLHVTLAYLGEAADWTLGAQTWVQAMVRDLAGKFNPILGEAFSVNVFNPGDEESCVVLGVSGEEVAALHDAVLEELDLGPVGLLVPDQHEPWVAHLTLNYTGDYADLEPYTERTGYVLFDRIRVAWSGEYIDYQLVPAPAPDDTAADTDSEVYEALTASVNLSSWKNLPIAERERPWNIDEVTQRLASWAGGDAGKYGTPWLWKAKGGQPLNPDSYRLPIADVVDGKLVLIPRAVFQAGVILSGGHGALEGVVSDTERAALKAVVTQIYNKLQAVYQDPRIVAPWMRGRTRDERAQEEAAMNASITASVNSSFGGLPIADASHSWDASSARARIWNWADGDFRKYRRGFVWWDESSPELKNSYKLPVADVLDGQLTIIPRAVSTALAAVGGARSGLDVPDSDMSRIEAALKRIQSRIHGATTAAGDPQDPDAFRAFLDRAGAHDCTCYEPVTASASLLTPPREWFADPKFTGPTPLTVTADGRVYGHLAAWGTCHVGRTDKCVMAPESRTGYKYFSNGHVLTADGSMVRVGRITVGTGHADLGQSWMPAAEHYDNTGTAVAIVAAGEDSYGIWLAGSVIPGVSEERIAELRRSPLSGDWRPVPTGGVELVAALAVNTPGFPIVRMKGDDRMALVAAGMVLPEGMSFPDPVTAAAAQEAVDRLATLDEKINRIAGSHRAARMAALGFGG